MKVILKEDIIQAFASDSNANAVEVGRLPRNVGLERLRWTGTEVVDIEKLDVLYVRGVVGGGFELHAVQVPGSQRVEMNYLKDRKRLHCDNGVFKVKTEQQVLEHEAAQLEHAALKKAILEIKGSDEKQNEMDAMLLCFMCALVVYSVNQPPQLKTLFESLVPHIKDAFPLDKWQDKIIKFAEQLKKTLDSYNQNF